jgi:glycosyltransferase involved in cell wall biosynthesis
MDESAQDKRKKILFVLPALTSGGAEKVMVNLANAIDRSLYEPVFLSLSREGDLFSIISLSNDVPQHYLERGVSLFGLHKIYKTIKDIAPDIVFSTMTHTNFAMLLVGMLLPKVRFIVRESTLPSYFYKERPRLAPVIGLMYRVLYPRAAMVICPSQIIARELRGVVGLKSGNVEVLYNSIDQNDINRRVTLGVVEDHGDVVRFVGCGRLNYQKGFDRLVEELATFRPEFEWRLDLIGDGEQRAEIEAKIVEAGLADKIFLHGLMENPCPAMAAADYLLLPSRFEGLPNVAIEALACGTPVIATRDAGGIVEIASESAADSVQIAEDMTEFVGLMAAAKRKEFAQKGKSLLPVCFLRETVMQRFYGLLARAAG